MAGIVIFYQSNSSSQARENDFQKLVEGTCKFKEFPLPGESVLGQDCTAAKLDTGSSLHRGIIRDESSGSWLIAAGTVVALEGDNDPQVLLVNLLKDYIDAGISALDKVDGQFGLVIYNGYDHSLSIISDPMGLFAVYYARRGDQILVSTSTLALAQQVSSKADTLTSEIFLRTGRPYGEYTLWKDVKRILPATLIKIKRDKFEQFEYWTPKVDEHIAHLSMKPALELANEKICRIFRQSLSREGKVWADLTGGFDTRLITMYLDKLKIPFVAYSVGPSGHIDIEIPREVSEKMGWDYRPLHLSNNWTEEQFAWFNAALGKGDGLLNMFQLTATLRFAQERSQLSQITIPGTGVDEWRYHIFGANTIIAKFVSGLNYDTILDAKIFEDIPLSAMSQDRTLESRDAIIRHLSRSVNKYCESKPLTQIDIAFLRYRHPIHGGAYLSAQAGMMRSVIPFCFKELENFGFSMNHQWRIAYDYRFFRHLMEQGNTSLANIRTEKGGPMIPIRVTNLYKFIPLGFYLVDHALPKITKTAFNKHIALRKHHQFPSYPDPEWKKAWLRWAVTENLLDTEKMISSKLYNPVGLGELVEKGLAGKQTFNEFLDRVATIELSMRATGAMFD